MAKVKEIVLQGDYGYGWDDVCYAEDAKEATELLKCYRENEPQYRHRLITRWEEE